MNRKKNAEIGQIKKCFPDAISPFYSKTRCLYMRIMMSKNRPNRIKAPMANKTYTTKTSFHGTSCSSRAKGGKRPCVDAPNFRGCGGCVKGCVTGCVAGCATSGPSANFRISTTFGSEAGTASEACDSATFSSLNSSAIPGGIKKPTTFFSKRNFFFGGLARKIFPNRLHCTKRQ